MSFTRTPTGRVNVDMPQASVTISIPNDSGGLQEVFGIAGAARFHFGGPDGFQLEDLRVSGYSIFGVGATIAAPASSLRAPTADLANPTATSIVSINDLTYLAVTYQDPNRVGLNDDVDPRRRRRIPRDGDQARTAPRSPGLTVNNGAVQKVADATNDRTFLYPITMTDAFKAAVRRPASTVTVTSSSMRPGPMRAAPTARPRSSASRCTRRRRPVRRRPPQPYATLASPANGGTVSLPTLNAQRYIDVTFFSPTGALIDAAQHRRQRAADHRRGRREPREERRRHGDGDRAATCRQHLPLPADDRAPAWIRRTCSSPAR